jgi:hypothetical protein
MAAPSTVPVEVENRTCTGMAGVSLTQPLDLPLH